MAYQDRWRLAVATKQAYPSTIEAGAIGFNESIALRTMTVFAGVAAVGAAVGYAFNGGKGAGIGAVVAVAGAGAASVLGIMGAG